MVRTIIITIIGQRSGQSNKSQRTVAHDIRIRDIELLVPFAKIVKADPDGGCKRPVSFMLGHLFPTCLQPFECGYCPCDSRFAFTRESMLCLGDFLLRG